ncbi:hypothetical protein SBOR_0462 [Sclerotinia borealis F-4128]|uniref:BTB domain-containing protein n=1 Tax=Sclerotinia borealis (strain F-4128) TaxID=1432307 RepID=W9CTC7_SCLBF|nr:hypothetical protein SBOR_0462 [Sclerotinia borealis F-4128]
MTDWKDSKIDGDTIIVDPDRDVVLILDLNKNVSDVVVDATSTDSPSKDISSTDSPSNDTSSADSSSIHSTVNKSTTTDSKKIRFVVSSKHMSLASPVFKAMLQGNFQECLELKETVNIEIPLPDDDSTAWKILINLIHGRNKSVPLHPALQVVTQVAVLVDKYRMHEIVYMFTPEITRVVQCEGLDPFGETLKRYNLDHLPIPQPVTDRLEASRQNAMDNAFEILRSTILRYQNESSNCEIDAHPNKLVDGLESHRKWCDMLVHASLVESATKQSIFPIPKAPYDCVSFLSLQLSIRQLNIVTACYILKMRTLDKYGIHETLIASINAAGEDLIGLRIDSLKKQPIQTHCPTQ